MPACMLEILATGARTPLGRSAPTSAAALRAGIVRLREHPRMVDRTGEPFQVAMDQILAPWRAEERMAELAISAVAEALAGARPPRRTRILLALPEPGPRFPEDHKTRLCARISAAFTADVVAIPRGHAAGFLALAAAERELADDGREHLVVAGVDSYIDPHTLEALDDAGLSASPSRRWGFPPGEAAAALVVVRRRPNAPRTGATAARVLAVATCEEPATADSDPPCIGIGLGRALSEALTASATTGIRHALCDLNGERHRDREYAFASQRLPTDIPFDPTAYTELASACGDIGAATGVFLAVVAACWAERGLHRGADLLLWAASPGRDRGAAVLRT